MQKTVIAALTAVALLTALPTAANKMSTSFDQTSIALAHANGDLLILKEDRRRGLVLALAAAE